MVALVIEGTEKAITKSAHTRFPRQIACEIFLRVSFTNVERSSMFICALLFIARFHKNKF